MKIIRVFPRKTSMTPDDKDVRVNCFPDLFDEADKIHVSVTFTTDLQRAEELAKQWERVAPVRIGGPATGERGVEFVSGMYLKKGCVITSRGCPNHCWFCLVPKREGNVVRELPITEGWNILDDNILRCSEKHVRAVFEMLNRQKKPITFSGGLEAAALKDWHIELLQQLNLEQIFFAYDTPDDLEPLRIAGKKLSETNIKQYKLRAYCLIGYKNDTFEKAETRLRQCLDAGFMPMAMLYQREQQPVEWKRFQTEWARPAIIKYIIKTKTNGNSTIYNNY
ncbi:MAG: hypothetical protein LBL13_03070 [Bacteroidales bacterium]|jgi:hypothetical protein|nr:hypothetical protein [Bacteroidales bacterium]